MAYLAAQRQRRSPQAERWYWYLGLVIVIYMLTIGLFQFWFRLPGVIYQDPYSGSGYALGCVAVTALGFWLMRRGRKG
jgi:hypothetical protein